MNRRDKGRGRGHRNEWQNITKYSRNRTRPPGLRGKEIGLYYRDLGKKKTKKEVAITIGIPATVESRLCTNLRTIAKLGKKFRIPVVPFQTPFPITISSDEDSKEDVIELIDDEDEGNTMENISWESNVSEACASSSKIIDQSNIFKKPKLPCPSTAPEFIPIGQDNSEGYDSGTKQLSLRGGGDYKYGYEDIITGSFDEKLDECIAKGISINVMTQDIIDINMALHEEYKDMQTRIKYRNMMEFRKKLPAYKKATELLDAIENNQVIVISGETGCGKSTQVPQLILDNAICKNQGGNVHIVCTQPRRIAASSLAMRVAEERAEPLGDSVGYAVRLEKVDARPRGSIMFVTTGVLLAELEINQALANYSHVILDEVHERDCHIDLSMCMLKKVLKKRRDLKLILMSATIDAEKLSEYFDNCPMMHIEGLAYPVEDVYLEDILLLTDYKLPPPENKDSKGPRWRQHTKNFKQRQGDQMQREIQYRAEISHWLNNVLKARPELLRIKDMLLDPRIEDNNMDILLALLVHICKRPPGAILVFLPGIGDITKLIRLMYDSHMFPRSYFEIYPLHSKLASLEQHKIFERPREGVRKIIIATNIAETSITIDDIVYVIDGAKLKISGLNVQENFSTLNTEFVSKANLRQRRGRAGRCQPGICFHLLTSYRAECLRERLLPELQRSDLLEPVLSVKRLRLGRADQAMREVPSPPAASTVDWAVKHLQQCGALNDKEVLTPLGWHLARLPVHPSAGKLLLLGALFGCLDRAASVAAVWGFKDPFQLVIGKEQEVDKIKRRFALGEPSDHVAISEAIIQWERCSNFTRRSFAYDHFLSNNTLELLTDMKSQLGDSLKQMGFLPSGNVRATWENRNADNLSLFKAIVAASLYPKVAFVKWVGWNKRKPPRIKVSLPECREDGSRKSVSVHPSSIMATSKKPGLDLLPLCNEPGANWLVYWLLQKSSDLFLIEVTLVYTLPLLFFGECTVKKITDDSENSEMCLLSISSINVRCKQSTASSLFELRGLLDQVLASRVMVGGHRDTVHSEYQESVLNAVIELITAEDERAEYPEDDSSEASERE